MGFVGYLERERKIEMKSYPRTKRCATSNK
jgi:hypothetical protein